MTVSIEASRVERVLQVIVAAVNGDYDARVPLEEHDDLFLEVETGVNFLLDELVERREQNRDQRDALATSAGQLADQQSALVAALSTPIIEVWPGVLALPLIGRVDDARAATITATLLARVAATRASHVVLDLTGVTAVDEGTMPAVVRVVRAIGLLGAVCVLTGMGPAVARQVVAQGIDASRVNVMGQLSDALAAVLADRGALRQGRT
jgi:rsbT co-antagonist protein RsbR